MRVSCPPGQWSEALTICITIGANVSALSFSIFVCTGSSAQVLEDDMCDVCYSELRKLVVCHLHEDVVLDIRSP